MSLPRTRDVVIAVMVMLLALGWWARFGADFASSAESVVSPAEAREHASYVSLRFEDLPDLISTPPRRITAEERRIENEVARCTGIKGDEILRLRSPEYLSGDPDRPLSIQSEVQVGPTSEEVSRAAEAALSPRGLRCFLTGLRRKMELDLQYAPGYELERILVERADVPASVPRSWGLRAAAVFRNAEGDRVTNAVDVLGFFQGPSAVTLTLAGSPAPVPTETGRRLLELLHDRASADALGA